MNTTKNTHERRRRSGNQRVFAGLTVAVMSFILVLGGCEGMLDVQDPDIITPDNLLDETGLQTLRNGAIGNFVLAYVGGGQTDGQIMTSGLMSDEWMHSGTFPTRQEVELRIIPTDNGTMNGVYLRLQRARNDLEQTAEKLLNAQDPASDSRIPEMYAYAGFTYMAFGENYCSGVPFSVQPDTGEAVYGEGQTTTEIFNAAVARFDEALAHAAVSTSILNMARVGKGRALLNLGDYDGAAAAVAAVPDDFVRYTDHSNNSARERNSVYEFNFQARRWSVGDLEGVNGLDFRTSNDPRIMVSATPDPRLGFDQSSDLWIYLNYTDRGDRVPLATGVEARLIEAEAVLSSDPAAWLQILNDLRADFATLAPVLYPDNTPTGTLAPLTDPGTVAGREDLHFRERAFWLFSTGHRLGDMRRLIRQYGRGIETVFPTGAYFKAGSTYGTDVNFPIPQDEENNPNFTACLDRNP